MADRSSAKAVPPERGQAPGDLEKVRAFVNTLDIDEGSEELTSPAALTDWLRRSDLADGAPDGAANAAGTTETGITAADLALALRLREALRAALQSHVPPATGLGGADHKSADHTGADHKSGSVADLQEIAADLPIRLEIDPDGRARAGADGTGGPAALARLLLITAEAATLGTWSRLKVCSADDCQWAFYDRSPTRSGCWCSMQACGARAKSRAYRRRAAAKPAQRHGGQPG